jgi:hypothetical protein
MPTLAGHLLVVGQPVPPPVHQRNATAAINTSFWSHYAVRREPWPVPSHPRTNLGDTMSTTPTQRPERTTTGARAAADSRSTGARAIGGERHRKRRMGWLWWLLGLLALAAIAALLLGAFDGDDEKAPATAGQNGQPGSTEAGGGTAASGALAAGGTSLLPVPDGGLSGAVGQDAQGRDVIVQSVVKGQEDPDARDGFWVGSSQQDRVYVEWGGDVGANEADYQPKVGDKVNLTGPVHAAPQDPEQTLNLNGDDAQLVRSQGGYVNADEVTPASG